MLVERAKNEILIRIPSDFDDDMLQSVLDLIHIGEKESKNKKPTLELKPNAQVKSPNWWSALTIKLF